LLEAVVLARISDNGLPRVDQSLLLLGNLPSSHNLISALVSMISSVTGHTLWYLPFKRWQHLLPNDQNVIFYYFIFSHTAVIFYYLMCYMLFRLIKFMSFIIKTCDIVTTSATW